MAVYNRAVKPVELHRLVIERLAGCADVEFPRYEADRVIEHIFGVAIGDFWVEPEIAAPDYFDAEMARIAGEREKGVPLAYVLGYVYFGGVRIDVAPGVLIPRQETEGLAALGVELLTGAAAGAGAGKGERLGEFESEGEGGEKKILDFGTGSGCIAVYMALELPFSLVWATDVSPRAIKCATKNIKRYGLDMRVVPVQRDGLEGFAAGGGLDLIISNPPYIAEDDGRIDRSVRLYEPAEALIAPSGGLHYFRHLARWGPPLLKPGGKIAVEVGEGQAEEVKAIFWAAGAAEVCGRSDLSGICRYVWASFDTQNHALYGVVRE